VPGRKPADAVREYLQPLQRSISCLTDKVVRPSGYDTDRKYIATFSGTSARLRTTSRDLYLSFLQSYSIHKMLLGNYKVKTLSYMYAIENEFGHEIVAFHWHPESDVETVTFPHLHIGYGAGDRILQSVRDSHFPSARVSFEEVCHLLIDHFDVVPLREDAKDVLAENHKLFVTHKSW
jgi:hypothetical protein